MIIRERSGIWASQTHQAANVSAFLQPVQSGRVLPAGCYAWFSFARSAGTSSGGTGLLTR